MIYVIEDKFVFSSLIRLVAASSMALSYLNFFPSMMLLLGIACAALSVILDVQVHRACSIWYPKSSGLLLRQRIRIFFDSCVLAVGLLIFFDGLTAWLTRS